MDLIAGLMTIYVIPPALSILTGWTLAVISVVKGKFRTENIFFSLVCIWWTLMPVIYVSHHLFRGNTALILTIERSIHFFYVYMPFIVFIYLWKSFEFKRKYLIIFSLIQSIIISIFVPTDYYISGLYTYSWGYTAIGGVVFKIFGISAMIYTTYVIYFFIREISRVSSITERLKLKYILSSFIATALLMVLNLPSITGIDFYAFGNFMFIPMLLIAYAVLRYRLMDIRSVLHITLIWIVMSSLIIIPNVYIYGKIKALLLNSGDVTFFSILTVWFFSNYFYFVKIKPVIDRLFSKQKFNLRKSEARFIENVSLLKTIEELTVLFTGALKKDLCFRNAELYFRRGDETVLTNSEGLELHIDPELYRWFLSADPFIDRDLIYTIPEYRDISEKLIILFDSMDCSFILTFTYSNEINGMAFIGERVNAKAVSTDELKYIYSIKNAISISISNSVMYQKLSDLKDHLEEKVIERTEDMLTAMQRVEDVNRELTEINSELNEARQIAEMDMMMAVNVQKSIFPETPQSDSHWDVAAFIRPMSGVSGDLYDFYTQGDKLDGVMLLDVSGHGVASGLITMIARSVFYRNYFEGKALTLGKIMENANRDLIREIRNSEKFLTGILLRLSGNTVEYVNAGHPDIVVRKNNTGNVAVIRNLSNDTKGCILGMDTIEQPFQTLKFKVDNGDSLLAFSDGIFEAMNESEIRYGYDRLVQVFKATGQMASASEILDRIIEDFNAYTGQMKINDDITVIVLRKR